MGESYIFCLGAFISTAEQNDDRMSNFTEINTISGAEINFEFQYALSNRAALAQIPGPKARDSRSNLGASFAVFQRFQPLIKRTPAGLGLVDVRFFESGVHFILPNLIVVHRLHFVKSRFDGQGLAACITAATPTFEPPIGGRVD